MVQGKELPSIARMMDNQLRDIKALLLANDGEFDDAHTADADKLAKIAEVVGLRVVGVGRDDPNLPARFRIEAP